MTTNFQTATDKTAIGLSLLCAIHCLAFPLAAVFAPGLASLSLNSEAFHVWILAAVIPVSAYALTQGCRQHKRLQFFLAGIAGIGCLLAAVIFAETYGEQWERALTLIGVSIVAYAHYKNYRLCRNQADCACSEHKIATE